MSAFIFTIMTILQVTTVIYAIDDRLLLRYENFPIPNEQEKSIFQKLYEYLTS